jgi:hypothetical protein
MQTITLSESALALLHRRLAGERVEVTDESRPFYRELVEAGMMIPLHTFALGRDSQAEGNSLYECEGTHFTNMEKALL